MRVNSSPQSKSGYDMSISNVIHLFHDCDKYEDLFPHGKSYFPEGNARWKYDFSAGITLHISRTVIQ